MLKKIIKNLFGSKGEKKIVAAEPVLEPTKTITCEELCGIDTSTQTPEVIKQHLAVLYKRHNNAVSSLKPSLRDEAKQMLEAIAECRAKYVDENVTESEQV